MTRDWWACCGLGPLRRTTPLTLLAALSLGSPALLSRAALAGSTDDLLQLLEQRQCPRCNLTGADLVHARLDDVDLRQARLQRANLGQARLDGAQLMGADLSFTTLQGASLRGADLRSARLEGTDLRQADLSGALLDPGALSRAHWQGARGVDHGQLSFGELHNAGVQAAQQSRYPEAEQFFSSAIRQQPAAAVSWVARGITRGEQGKAQLAANDFNYAASLYAAGGEETQAAQLRQAAATISAPPGQPGGGGNGVGSALVGGTMGALQFLLPLAAKAFMPLPF
ncbi:pentapeptide repeat-containing protein [Cyanobium sp. LEGE 06143]|uniref:pentapeptide repeat-containing protein n=1 Tax=Cyanobium sp. LEGE 06143 TaxID=945727 RepID=UPI00187EC79E|nr:pentapeptide repeat-containing protein [Cyanobium sp. LEGE 06143]MBE9173886.1 pentapeptide repeat-containing protein [Cyanobium sp. LEGE 06143]